jgi:HEAT repeat protein
VGIPSDLDDPAVRRALLALASDLPDPPTAAIESLVARGKEIVPVLLASLEEDSLGGVAFARILDVLVTVDPLAALQPALHAVADERSHVQHAARQTLGQIPGHAATQALDRLAASSDPDAAAHARILLDDRRRDPSRFG